MGSITVGALERNFLVPQGPEFSLDRELSENKPTTLRNTMFSARK